MSYPFEWRISDVEKKAAEAYDRLWQLDAPRPIIEAQYRRLRSQCHPDKGGDAENFDRVQKAYEKACEVSA